MLQGQRQQKVSRRDKELSDNMAAQEKDEQLKIETIINSIQVEENLDKDQLHEAFISAGLDEVTDTVRHKYKAYFLTIAPVLADRPDIFSAR